MKTLFTILYKLSLAVTVITFFNSCREELTFTEEDPGNIAPPQRVIFTKIESPETGGNIGVRIELPEKQRYEDGAPVIIEASPFFNFEEGFESTINADLIGVIKIQYLWPGLADPFSGQNSDGEFDYGGANSQLALQYVAEFALGKIEDVNSNSLSDLITLTPLHNNVGIYAFGNSGAIALNSMAKHGQNFNNIKYFIGREVPTFDALFALETGYFDERNEAVINPFYNSNNYTAENIDIDYSKIDWLINTSYPAGIPIFIIEGNIDFVTTPVPPVLFGKRFYSVNLLEALQRNANFDPENRPIDLPSLSEAEKIWEERNVTGKFTSIFFRIPSLRTMIVFAERDHKIFAIDKPHIRQLYDGFTKAANFWTRLNPDLSYVENVFQNTNVDNFPDNASNTEPGDWHDINAWSYKSNGAEEEFGNFAGLAAIAEMADRTRSENWSANLSETLFNFEQ